MANVSTNLPAGRLVDKALAWPHHSDIKSLLPFLILEADNGMVRERGMGNWGNCFSCSAINSVNLFLNARAGFPLNPCVTQVLLS